MQLQNMVSVNGVLAAKPDVYELRLLAASMSFLIAIVICLLIGSVMQGGNAYSCSQKYAALEHQAGPLSGQSDDPLRKN